MPAPGSREFWKSNFRQLGGEEVDHGKSTPERVARRPAQALSQKSRQKRYLEHGAPQALVRFEERITPHPEEESHSPNPAKGTTRDGLSSFERMVLLP